MHNSKSIDVQYYGINSVYLYARWRHLHAHIFQMGNSLIGSTNPQVDWYVPVEWISTRILIFESIKSLQPFFFD